MKINELRIGNYVGFKGRTDCFCEIIELSMPGGVHLVRHFNDGTEDDQPEVIEDIKGIPIAEEWLLKFGFRKKENLYPINSPVYYISDIDIDYCFFYADFRKDFVFYIEYTDSPFPKDTDVLYPVSFGIKYVHQLQNLCFALTGEELTA